MSSEDKAALILLAIIIVGWHIPEILEGIENIVRAIRGKEKR